MPIEFAPPQVNLQGFNVQPPPQSNPLATLAQIAQLRNAGLQRQTAELGLEQQQIAMDSQRALMQALAQGNGDYDQTFKIAVASGRVAPADLMKLKEHKVKLDTDSANLQKAKLDAYLTQNDIVRGGYKGVTNQEQLDAANARLKAAGAFEGDRISPFQTYSDPEHLQAYINSIQAESQALTNAKLKREAEEAEQRRKLVAAQTTEAEQKVDLGARQKAIADLQALKLDPKTGTPTPAEWARFIRKYPNVAQTEDGEPAVMPEVPTKEWINQFVRTGVPVEKQPEYDIAQRMNAQGMMGKTFKDQMLASFAQNRGKTVAQLTYPEKQQFEQEYAKDTQNPEVLASILGLRGAQTTIAQAQAGAILSPQQIQNNARDLLSGDLFPKQIEDLRAGRVNQGPQIIEAARAMAEAEGKKFSLGNLEQQAKQREKTLDEFMNTTAGHVGGQKMALNTVIHHADLYLDVAAALKNGTFVPGNAIYNKFRTMFGDSAPTKADLMARFFASETAKVAQGGVPAESEIHGILNNLSKDASPKGMEEAGKLLIQIAAGRMGPMKSLRDKARLQELVDILDEDSKEILQRRGFDPETMKPVAAGGKAGPIVVIDANGVEHPFPSEAAAKRFEDLVKAAHGTTRRK